MSRPIKVINQWCLRAAPSTNGLNYTPLPKILEHTALHAHY